MGDWPILQHTKFAQDDVSPGTYKVVLSASGSADTKSSYTQLVASAPFDVGGLILCCQINNNSSQLLDIAVGGAGSEVIVVPNLLVAGSGGSGVHFIAQKFVPIFIRKGSRIAVRFAGSGASAFFNLKTLLMQLGGFALLQPPQKYEDWGTVVSGSKGTVITTNTTGNVKGSYAQLIAATGLTSRWVIMSYGIGSVADLATDIAIGAAGSEQIIFPNWYTTNETAAPYLLLPWYVRKGSRIAARAAQGSAGAATVGLQILGGT